MMALTATASNAQKKKIKTSLSMTDNCVDFVDSTDRENIQLNIAKVSHKLELQNVLKFIIVRANNEGHQMRRHIIFCSKRGTIGLFMKYSNILLKIGKCSICIMHQLLLT